MTATATATPVGAVAGSRDAGAPGSPPPSRSGWVERCRPYVNALWVLASISAGASAAEGAVVDAVLTAGDDPAATAAGPSGVWSLLVRYLETATISLRPAATAGRGATPARRQAVALVVGGCRPAEVADLLGAPLTQVLGDLRTGLHDLRPLLVDQRPAAE